MKRWTNGLPGAAKRLGAMMALRGLSGSQPGCARIPMMARSNIAPLKRPDTLMQLSRSPARHSTLHRAAGPYIPGTLAAHVRARTDCWTSIPVLNGIIEHPIILGDGRLLQEDGYDRESGLLLDTKGIQFPPIL